MVVGLSFVLAALAFTGPAGARTPARWGHHGSAAGQRVYMHNCARCHGAGGKGRNGPSLTRTALDPGEIEQTVSWGRPPKMPSFEKRLSAPEIKAVSAYVRSLGGRS
jgi:mono/diheme cytochrome c family protein